MRTCTWVPATQAHTRTGLGGWDSKSSFVVSGFPFLPRELPSCAGYHRHLWQQDLEQAVVPALQHLSFPTRPVPPPPHSSAPRVLQVGVFTSLSSPRSQINACKLGYFGYCNTAIKSNAKCQI